MPELSRFGVSLDSELLHSLDELVRERKYASRSHAIKDFVRRSLVKKDWARGAVVAGALTLVHDCAPATLAAMESGLEQHREEVAGEQRLRLDAHTRLSVIALHGNARRIQQLADLLRGIKGVRHGGLSMTATGGKL